MGFSLDPGPLPFVTIRRHDWANRLTLGELIEVHGEHGCPMPPTAARVVSIEDHLGPCPSSLATVYAGKRLVAIALEPAPGKWEKVGETWVNRGA
jgi:hypothetical protein